MQVISSVDSEPCRIEETAFTEMSVERIKKEIEVLSAEGSEKYLKLKGLDTVSKVEKMVVVPTDSKLKFNVPDILE